MGEAASVSETLNDHEQVQNSKTVKSFTQYLILFLKHYIYVSITICEKRRYAKGKEGMSCCLLSVCSSFTFASLFIFSLSCCLPFLWLCAPLSDHGRVGVFRLAVYFGLLPRLGARRRCATGSFFSRLSPPQPSARLSLLLLPPSSSLMRSPLRPTTSRTAWAVFRTGPRLASVV